MSPAHRAWLACVLAAAACGPGTVLGGGGACDDCPSAPAGDPDFFDDPPPVAPYLAVREPARGRMLAAPEVTVAGLARGPAGFAVTVGGEAVAVGPDGRFSATLAPAFGLNLIDARISPPGDDGAVRQSFLHAARFVPAGEAVADAIRVRVNAAGLDAIGDLAARHLTPALLPDLPRPLFAADQGWYGLEFYVEDGIRFRAPAIAIEPAEGHLTVEATVRDVRVPWRASGEALRVGFDVTGEATAERVTLTGRLTPALRDGALRVTLAREAVRIDGFDLGADGLVWDAMQFLGLDGLANDRVRGLVEDVLRGAVRDQIPPLIERTLRELGVATAFEIAGREFAVAGAFSDLRTDRLGLTVGLDVGVSGPRDPAVDPQLGSLHRDYARPSFGPGPGFRAAVSANFVNQALHALWQSGLTSRTFARGTLALPVPVPGVDLAASDVVVRPLLPPQVRPAAAGETWILEAGDLLLEVHDLPAIRDTPLIRAAVSLRADVTPVVSGQGLGLEIGALSVVADVLANRSGLADDQLIALLETLAPATAPALVEDLARFPLPRIPGVTLARAGLTGDDGADHGWVTVGADVVP